ncbi:monosaccharide ABC transporter membrane protein, CUT2 family [Blastococcus sp. DSM 46786]|uniref:ABC transporter permease n=1 Tax=Blastococcus sp. DSM 46786 TaxID=1798227 RepID=UPI0008C3A8F3|nr:ABC transporter permease [Blastococcus sp. DSM 46786]SEM08163.1 monosaccharide ABC transporter membrane protein, CUT2 family [Blastococcus sp. DSM 46786]
MTETAVETTGPRDDDGPAPGAGRRSRRDLALLFMPGAVLVLLLLALSTRNPDLLSPDSLLAIADSAAPLMVLAIGVTVVILCGGIDLSIAALAALSSVLFALWIPLFGAAAAVPVIAVAALAGAVQGLVHVKAKVNSFIVTLGGLALWSGIALVISGARTVPVTDVDAIRWAFTTVAGLPSAVLIALGAVVVLGAVLRLTPAGRWVRAVGHAEQAARLAGIPVGAVKVAAFTTSGACAGLAGVLLVARTFSGAPSLGATLLLPAVAAVVVGGTAITGGFGGIGRTVIGALIVIVLRVGLSLIGVDAGFESIIYGVLIIGAVAVTIDRTKLDVLK